VPFGIVAVAAAFVIRGYLLLPLNLYWMRVYAGIRPFEYLRQLRGIALATLVMALAVVLVKVALGGVLTPAGLLGVELLVAAVALPLALLVLERRLLDDVLEIAGQAIPGLERVARRLRRRAPSDAAG
jgi:O-antigen/teichoic acid export membrane protein